MWFSTALLFGDAMQIGTYLLHEDVPVLAASYCDVILALPQLILPALLPYEWSWFFRCMFRSMAAATGLMAVVALRR